MAKRFHHPQIIDAESLDQLLVRRPGLLIGPDATVGAAALDDCAASLADRFSTPRGASVWHTAESVLPENADVARQLLREYWAGRKSAPELSSLCRFKWRVVASLTLDSNFESEYAARLNRNPNRGGHLTIHGPDESIPPRMNPVFKLLGDPRSDSFPMTRTQLEIQRALADLFPPNLRQTSRWPTYLCWARQRYRSWHRLPRNSECQ